VVLLKKEREVNDMDKKIQEYCSKILSALAKKAAKRDANSCCSYITYQPKLPEAVKKLKK